MVQTGGMTYPIYVAFMSAAQIIAVAETPQFYPTTAQQSLAASVLRPNMDDWQRPLDLSRVAEIARVFAGQNELMPNPVLLSENGNLAKSQVTISQQRAGNSMPTNVWELEIIQASSKPKALWILDGQHRIHGLNDSKVQANNLIPVVLLLNDLPVYSGSILAKIFAQVTTGAKKLDALHNEWLTYAFRLGDYDNKAATALEHQQSMETVAKLCSSPQFSVGQGVVANPFLNNIKFNEQNPLGTFPFGYDCTDFKALVHKHYYGCTSSGPHLSPDVLASEISRAYQALQVEVTSPQNSVFLGDSVHAQRLMKDAFIAAVLNKLLSTAPPVDWQGLLRALQFSTTSWDFKQWISTLSAQSSTASRNVAYKVLKEAFSSGLLVAGNLADYLRGNAASVDLVCSTPTPQGRASSKNGLSFNIIRGATISPTIQGRRHLILRNASSNIATLRVVDGNSRPGKPVPYTKDLTGRGLILNSDAYANPIKLEIMMEFYGGVEVPADVTISWV